MLARHRFVGPAEDTASEAEASRPPSKHARHRPAKQPTNHTLAPTHTTPAGWWLDGQAEWLPLFGGLSDWWAGGLVAVHLLGQWMGVWLCGWAGLWRVVLWAQMGGRARMREPQPHPSPTPPRPAPPRPTPPHPTLPHPNPPRPHPNPASPRRGTPHPAPPRQAPPRPTVCRLIRPDTTNAKPRQGGKARQSEASQRMPSRAWPSHATLLSTPRPSPPKQPPLAHSPTYPTIHPPQSHLRCQPVRMPAHPPAHT
jgi:hypothetical protein